MKLGKLFSVIAASATVAVAALAQPSDDETNVVWIAVQDLGSSITFNSSLIATPAPVNQNSIDLGGRGGIRYVQVTTYVRFTPDATLGRLGLINTYVPVAGIPGVSVVDNFPNNNWDGGLVRSDARKNARSHDVGNRDIDSASNDLAENSARPYDTTVTQRAGAGAAGKSLFPGGITDPGEGALYSFILRVDTDTAPLQIDLNFGRVGFNQNRVVLRTNFGYEFSQDFAPAVYGATILVPEPASMIALGSGLVGLLALRRRRSN